MSITQDMLIRLFDYDGKALIWRERPLEDFKTEHACNTWNTCYAGKAAGWVDDGYVRISVNGSSYRAHRLIFLRHHGYLPEQTDHINHIRDDNRIVNLRDANSLINNHNRKLPATNTSGHIGVHWYEPTNKWQARIRVNNRQIHLGYFDEFYSACTARATAEIKHGFHPNHGRSSATVMAAT